MKDLIARLEAAEAGSRELDEAVSTALCDSKFRTCIEGLSDEQGGMWMYEFDGHAPSSALRVTTSLDTALALAERVCPDHHSSVGNLPVSDDADYEEHHSFGALLYSRYTKPYDALGHGATRPLALCIAILKAKLAEQPTKG